MKTAEFVSEPGWWKGIHGELKIRCPQGHVGSNPTPGTKISYLRVAWRRTSRPIGQCLTGEQLPGT